MLSLLGSLLGFGGSIIPGILDSFKKKQDQKYELRKLEVQAEINRENLEHQARLQKELGKQKIELFQAQAKDKEHERLIQHDIVLQSGTGFIGGLGSILLAVLPVTILWYILTGGSVFGMDVVANLTALITGLGNGGFVGLIVLVLLASFFVKK